MTTTEVTSRQVRVALVLVVLRNEALEVLFDQDLEHPVVADGLFVCDRDLVRVRPVSLLADVDP